MSGRWLWAGGSGRVQSIGRVSERPVQAGLPTVAVCPTTVPHGRWSRPVFASNRPVPARLPTFRTDLPGGCSAGMLSRSQVTQELQRGAELSKVSTTCGTTRWQPFGWNCALVSAAARGRAVGIRCADGVNCKGRLELVDLEESCEGPLARPSGDGLLTAST